MVVITRRATSDGRGSGRKGLTGASIGIAAGVLFTAAGITSAWGQMKETLSKGISNVSVSRPFFNPALGQKIRITFDTSPGAVAVRILDRDGYVIRTLVTKRVLKADRLTFDWEGHDDHGAVVPDEAYSLKVDLTTDSRVQLYFPASDPPEDVPVKTNYYDRRGAILSYRLPKAARVHVQAGIAKVNPRSRSSEGPVLKTIVNREPRPAGAVVENWTGFDESGSFYVPDLRDFVISIAATSLPENTIITTGNRKTGFLEYATRRSGASLLPEFIGGHEHHRGLAALEDVAPALKAVPTNAAWSPSERLWRPSGKKLRLSFSLTGPSAESFQREPGKLWVFLDENRMVEVAAPRPGESLDVPLNPLSNGTHVVGVNWASAYGPVAVDAFRIIIGKAAPAKSASFKRGSQ